MVHWGGLCCLGAAALYLLSQRTGRDIEFLKSVTRVYQLKDLAQLLEEESTVLPSIIAVSGRVGSETPIKCEHSGILGVIVEKTAEKHFLKRNWKFSWVQDRALMLPMSKEVPWYLDDGTGRVNVAGAQGAIGFTLTVGGEVFEKSEPSSFVRGILDYLRGLKMLGIRRIERVLPIGTRLTVVGQTIKDGNGDVKIQKSDQGPFYVSPMPLDQLISSLGNWSRWFKNVAMGLTLIGVILISKPVIEHILVRIGEILERRRQRLLRERVVDAAARTEERATEGLERQQEIRSVGTSRYCVICLDRKYNTTFVQCDHMCYCMACFLKLQKRVVDAAARRVERGTEGLERQLEIRSVGTNTYGDASDLCVICLDRKSNAAFVPCGHMCCCMTCSSRLQGKTCPICREPVRRILRIYRN